MEQLVGLFEDVAEMVGDQGRDLDAAEDHALAAEGHMRAAVHELSDAEVSATKARRRKVCIALVVGLVVAGLAAFLAIWLSR